MVREEDEWYLEDSGIFIIKNKMKGMFIGESGWGGVENNIVGG